MAYPTYMPQNSYYPQQGYPQQGYQQPPAPQPVQPQMQPNMPQGVFKVCPVTSREEALGAQIDFLGPGTLMPDIAHGKVFLKRFNQNTGATELHEFVYRQPKEPKPAPQYATAEELEALRAEIKQLKEGRHVAEQSTHDDSERIS